MDEPSELLTNARTQADVLARVAAQWSAAVRALPDGGSAAGPALPLRDLAQQFLGPDLLLTRVPPAYHDMANDAVRRAVASHLRRAAARVFAARPEVLRRLSDVVYEAASLRVLISERDAFDVGGWSVLSAAALCNLFHLAALWQKAPPDEVTSQEQVDPQSGEVTVRNVRRNPIRQKLLKSAVHVQQTLRRADDLFRQLSVGDLWFADLAARTARLLYRAMTGRLETEAQQETARWLRPLVLEFVTRSTLHKLLDAEHLAPDLAREARYDLWPGLDTLLTAPEAGGVRTLLLGELTRQVAVERRDVPQVALLRFLKAATQTPEPLRPAAALLVAGLFWELLDTDETMLMRLMKRGKVAAPLTLAIQFVEQMRETAAPQTPVGRRLRELCAALRCYSQYESLLALAGTPAAAVSSPDQ